MFAPGGTFNPGVVGSAPTWPTNTYTLNDEGRKTVQGAKWTAVQVGRVLARRALYEGHYAYADVEAEQGQQEPILQPPSPAPMAGLAAAAAETLPAIRHWSRTLIVCGGRRRWGTKS